MNKNYKVYFFLAVMLILISICTCTVQLTEENDNNYENENNENSFLNRCYNPRIIRFTIRARCMDVYDNYNPIHFDISNCIFNYYGSLTTRYTNRRELLTHNCYTDGYNLICQCMQYHYGYKKCSISLDEFLKVDKNGELYC